MKIYKPTLKAIHICNSLSQPQKPKIAKEYVFANAHFRTNIITSENQAGRGNPAYNNV
ncbi:hypothetical protein [Jejuia pallidilutea]|uniref:Uncharacterized protein n=1 Tax=Jejuia pallidilutea TaxID=504487 RepID=A0A090WB15_9FLAO|nr:hypothetical protein [Jejuia pallidilutea]GAL69150.1 hypothetical protein JCM19301_2331 [Jejuia pallidilutea]GAL73388.1 hypothetical protein JCM19302_3669 [Jejuia pallidilutea]GAL89529.1 hypothetical protein JCM19538_1277 [Jejuia pallidilutea]